jgi:cytochrome c
MDYYRLNQIAMAVLGALLLFFGAKTIIHIAFEEPEEKPGYDTGTEPDKKPGKPGGGGDELPALLAAADAKHGEEVAKKCGICHNFEKGGPNMIGPNLYGVLGRKIASHEGYEYSDALKAKGGNWDYAMINAMITNPAEYVPGTKMALFPGLPDAKERADVLVFLRTKNDNPPALPEVAAGGGSPSGGEPAKPGGEPEKPGGGTATGGGSEIAVLLASADPKQGEADAALCKVCHTFDKGGAVVVGPNLYGVVGRKIASVEGFNYTPGLKAHDGVWTYELLDTWITNPQAFAPGTMMAFPGEANAKKRADIVAFLRSKNDNPPPLPGGASSGGAADKATASETPSAPAPEAAAPAAEPTPAPASPPAEAAPPAASAEPAPSAGTPAPPAETPAQ